jgi:hypothetical protein
MHAKPHSTHAVKLPQAPHIQRHCKRCHNADYQQQQRRWLTATGNNNRTSDYIYETGMGATQI